MRLLLIGPVPPPVGGTSVLFQCLQDELNSRGEFEVITINTVSAGRRFYSLPVALIWQCLRILWFLPQVDVVSLHASTNRFIIFGGILRCVCRIFNRPLILRVFGGSLVELGRTLRGLRRACYRSAMRSDMVLVEIKEMLQQLQLEFPNAELRWFANSRPLDVSRLTALPSLGEDQRKVIFTFISHVRREKGIYELAQAVQLLGHRDDYEVQIYGPLFADVDLSKVEVSEEIKYHGELSSDAVYDALNAADVLLLPSWYDGEGYPGTILEAYSLGRPVIATRWKYIPEVVEDSGNGLLVEPKDPVSLANAMKRVLEDRSLRQVLADGARQSASRYSSAHWNGDVFCGFCLEVSK